jgi:hypothetical protein
VAVKDEVAGEVEKQVLAAALDAFEDATVELAGR